MTARKVHSRIPEFPFAEAFRNGRLDRLLEETNATGKDLLIDFRELRFSAPPMLMLVGDKPVERVKGEYRPRRVRFRKLRWIRRTGLYQDLDRVPANHLARSLRGMMHWDPAGLDVHYLLIHGSPEPAGLMFSADSHDEEERGGLEEPADFIRSWSPAPPLIPGLVPDPKSIRRKYGGDPITIHLGNRIFHKRFFIGSLTDQGADRPGVDVVLNLGEEASRWLEGASAKAR